MHEHVVDGHRCERWVIADWRADVAEALAPYVAAGVHEFDMSLCAADTDAAIEMAGEVKRLLTA
jgi:hypothetical protein